MDVIFDKPWSVRNRPIALPICVTDLVVPTVVIVPPIYRETLS